MESVNLQSELDTRIAEAVAAESQTPSYNHGLYSYYVEPSVGRISSDASSNTFNYNGAKFVMNLNIPEIINSIYYTNKTVETNGVSDLTPAAKTEGTYLDYLGDEHEFTASIYEQDGQCLTVLNTEYAEFFAVSTPLEAVQLASVMMETARSLKVDTSGVAEAYSNKQTISYKRKRLELFQNIAPESGAIEDLFENTNESTAIGTEYFGDAYGMETTTQTEGDADDMDDGDVQTAEN